MQAFRSQFPPPSLSFFLIFKARQTASGPTGLFNSSPPDIPIPRSSRRQYHWYCVCSISVIFSLPFSLSKPLVCFEPTHTGKTTWYCLGTFRILKILCSLLIHSDPYTYTQFPFCHPLTLQTFTLSITSQNMPTLYILVFSSNIVI
jgi:hypothetical protein